MSSKIELTPTELLSQSAEMQSIKNQFESLFSQTTSTLKKMNSSWSPNLSNNFSGKIASAQKASSSIVGLLDKGATVARSSAETFESVDSLMAKNILGGSNAKADAYSAGGGGYASGGGGGGAFGGKNKDGSSANQQSFWSEQWEDIKDAWNESSHALKWLEKIYNEKVPEEIRGKLESVFPEAASVINITSDIITNDLSLDTLKTYMKAIGTEKSTISAITNTVKIIFDENSIEKQLEDAALDLIDLSSDCLLRGDVGGFFKDAGLAIASYSCAVLGGVVDVFSEMGADIIDVAANKVLGITDIVGQIVPGHTGEVICNFSESCIALTDKFTGWVRGLL